MGSFFSFLCNLFHVICVMKGDSCYLGKGGDAMTDADIVRKLRQKRTRALEVAIDRYGAYVATVIRNVLGANGTMEDAEELSSDVFFTLWEHATEVEAGKLKQWLGAVARNRARDLLRKRKTLLPMDQDVLLIASESPEDKAFSNLKKQELLDCIKAMGQPDKDIFLRYYYYYNSIEEIAQSMGLSVGTVKSKLHRGRKRLKERLVEQEVAEWN